MSVAQVARSVQPLLTATPALTRCDEGGNDAESIAITEPEAGVALSVHHTYDQLEYLRHRL
jgi:hypothetical protein